MGIICIVLGLFISSLKEAEMKSLDRAEIQDGKFHTITESMRSFKEQQVSEDFLKTLSECLTKKRVKPQFCGKHRSVTDRKLRAIHNVVKHTTNGVKKIAVGATLGARN